MNWILGIVGGFVLFLYGIVPTFQPSHFHRIYAAYGGIFIVMALFWGWIFESSYSCSSDMQYLRKQAKEAIKEYVTEHLPEQYQICLTALDTILKHSFEILQTSQDNREKLQAMELFKNTHLVKLELLSNATTIDSALNFIRNKQQEEEQQKGIATDLAAATTTTNTTIDTTTNKVF